MAEIQIFFIGTSKVKEIRKGGNVKFEWGAYGSWTNFKSPKKASSKNVKYNKTSKDKVGSQKYGGLGGKTVLGSSIPSTAQRMISGVERTCEVRYYQRGYTKYTRTSKLKKKKKMLKTVYTSSKPYQYRVQYKDKAVVEKNYSEYIDGKEYVFFGSHYFNDKGDKVNTKGHLPHPVSYEMSYSDIRKNFNSDANNSESRDNSGSYILSNVRANVVTLKMEWSGLTAEEGAELLDTLNPSKNSKGKYEYLTVQYLDYATGTVKNGTFFADAREANKLPNGYFEKIAVTLTEV